MANKFSAEALTAGQLLLINKPLHWTSFDVVNKVRFRIKKITQNKNTKVGHAGTLDPLATGLLIIGTGAKTKQLQEWQDEPKEYTGTFKLGVTTPSYDAETLSDADTNFSTAHITPEMVEAAARNYTGDILQYPPMFSAIKVDGKPLYKSARQGVEIAVEPRPIHIYSFEITAIRLPEVSFRVKCSKGTYIRSLAFDMGRALNSGAYLTELCRTKSGGFCLEDAWNLEDLIRELEQ